MDLALKEKKVETKPCPRPYLEPKLGGEPTRAYNIFLLAAARSYVATLQRCSAEGSRRFHPGNFRCRQV